ncbi:MAG: TatD family hydrolase [bacterium]
MFDTHLHLDPEDDPAALFAAGRAAGVTRFMVCGTTLADSARAQAVAASETGVLAAVGVHPHQAAEADGELTPFRELAGQPGVAAIGEIGLDYHYDHSPRAVQQRVFAAMLELAVAVRRPAIVHCREAFADALPLLRDAAGAGLRLVVHSFTGTPDEAAALLGLGAYLGYTGMITFPKAENVRATLRVTPLERILAETDAPWLAPVPHRGQRNQPAFLPLVLAVIAREKGVSVAEADRVTTTNACALFDRP